MTTKEYLELPYTKVVRRGPDGEFVARILELPGCVAEGNTESDALAAVTVMQELWISDALEAGHDVPMPEPEDDSLPSGKWLQRVPRTLHQRLVTRAQTENVSLNQLVTSILAGSLGEYKATNALQILVRDALKHRAQVMNLHLGRSSSTLAYFGYCDATDWNVPSASRSISLGFLSNFVGAGKSGPIKVQSNVRAGTRQKELRGVSRDYSTNHNWFEQM